MRLSPNPELGGSDRAAPPRPESRRFEAIDFESLLERCMGNLDFVERVLERFQERFPQQLAELERLLETKDAEQLAMAAHRIKGNSANVSATGLHRVAGEIEGLCRANRLGEIPRHVDRLHREWARYVDCSAQRRPAKERP
jgi:Amt family ammonium transporter